MTHKIMESNRTKALYEYNRWANHRIFDAVAGLTPEQYSRDLKSGHPSVRDTFVHLVSVEWIYLQRVHGTFPKSLWPPSEYPTVANLHDRWVALADEQSGYIARLTDDALMKNITYINMAGKPFTYALWQILDHTVNHSTYHRGQIVTMLRQLGAKPVSTDLLLWYDENG